MSEYLRPENLSEALACRRSYPSSVLLAGGTDLYIRFREKGLPEVIIDLSAVPELRVMEVAENGSCIGAGVTFTELEESFLSDRYPAIKSAAGQVGSKQIRNRGTIGGNICNASPAADLAPIWTVLEAEVETVRKKDELVIFHRIPVRDFITGTGKTELREDEIMKRLFIPDFDGELLFTKVARRDALAITRLSVAVAAVFAGSRIRNIRICVGGISSSPKRAAGTEKYLQGKVLTEQVIREAAGICLKDYFEVMPVRESQRYKKPVLERIVSGMLNELRGKAS